MRHFTIAFTAALVVSAPALADHLVQIEATDEQRAEVLEAIGAISCSVRDDQEIEWEEDAGIFEVDDASCQFGQYDIKVDADYNIISLTFDGTLDAPGAPAIEATPQEIEAIARVLASINCEIDEEAGVEKETGDMFELDDVDCEVGQFDIKLDSFYTIISMTRD